MRTWNEFVEAIDQLYSKAHIAVEIVRLYNPQILNNIAVISNLANGAYGVYNSGENQKIIPKNVESYLIYYGKVNRKNLNLIPKKTIAQYFPQLSNQIKESDTIHVNVRRIMQESGSDFEAIIEISSTIIHEATHEIERETTGTTSEVGPVNAEHAFMNWVTNNKNMLMSKFPELSGDLVGPKGQMPGNV